MLKKLVNHFIQWWSNFVAVAPAPHIHDWRHISGYFRQCRDRNCGRVEQPAQEEVPEGMQDYLQIMTTEAAHRDPIGEAKKYAADHLDYGRQCSVCGRVMVESDRATSFYCPYCGAGVQSGATGIH